MAALSALCALAASFSWAFASPFAGVARARLATLRALAAGLGGAFACPLAGVARARLATLGALAASFSWAFACTFARVTREWNGSRHSGQSIIGNSEEGLAQKAQSI